MKINDKVIDDEINLINARIVFISASEIIVREHYRIDRTLDIHYKSNEFHHLKIKP